MYRLLIADDEESMLSGLTTQVDWTSMNLQPVAVLRNGQDAIAYLRAHSVDVALCDIIMPGATGLDIARFVQEHSLPTCVILLSGYKEFEYAQQAMRYGVQHYLTKPFLMSTLRNAMQDAVERLSASRKQEDKETDTVPALAPERLSAAAAHVCAFIKAHYAQDITLQQAADLVYLNPVYLSRLFRAQTGLTFSDYITRTRIKAAMQLLATTRLPVCEVSKLTGYPNIKHFYRMFKRETGKTPTAYRHGLGWSSVP